MPATLTIPALNPSRLYNLYTGEPFKLEKDAKVLGSSDQGFPIRNGSPSFIKNAHPPLPNRPCHWFYDWATFAYDFTDNLSGKINLGSEGAVRREYIGQLPIQLCDTVS